MVFTSKRNISTDGVTLSLNNQLIYRTNTFKLLGITIDHNLNFQSHIDNIISKLNISLGVFFRIKKFINQQSSIILYYSLFYSHLYYGNLIWGHANKTSVYKLYLTQKKIIKIIFSFSNTISSNLFLKNNILSIYEINNYKTCILIFKIVNKILVSNDELMNLIFKFSNINNNYKTRTNKTFMIEPSLSKNKLNDRNICYFGPKIWNELPVYLRSITSYNSFKIYLKSFLVCKS